MPTATVNRSLRVDALQVSNFRCFRRLGLTFNTGARRVRANGGEVEVGPLTVIVARNGKGKTTVLDAVRVALGTFTSAFDYPSPVPIAKADIRIAPNGESQGGTLALPVSVVATGMVDGRKETWKRELLKENGRTTFGDARCVTAFGIALKRALGGADGPSVVLPLVAYYGTSRLWKEHKETDKDKPLTKPRDFGYDYCLDDNSNYKAVYRWMRDALWAELTAQHVSLAQDTVSRQLQAIRGALDCLLGREGYSSQLHFNAYFKELAVIQRNGAEAEGAGNVSVPVSALSDGVRAIFSMVADIAFRCAKLNPQFGEEACRRTPGVVLIDEIDQHLHPAWQQTVLDTLQAAFPLLQFIVTTHSPHVISSVPQQCVRILGDDGAVSMAPGQTQGVENQYILVDVFDTDVAPQEDAYVQMLNKYAQMANDGLADTEDGKRLHQTLAAHFGERYDPLLRIEFQRALRARKRG